MKFIKRLITLFVIIGLIWAGVTIKKGYDFYCDALEKKPLFDTIEELKSNPHYTLYENIPEFYFKALVAVEDRRYYKHPGFDIIGTTRAIYNDIQAGKYLEGGSTISQQLAKNLYFPFDYTLNRKIAEIFMALKIEKEYSKEEVLEIYVNAIYYGSGYYNIYDASMGYFDKTPAELNEYESSLLVGIPNAPSVYSLDVNPGLARQRQKKVLSTMVECGYITQEYADEIINNAK